jgi:hypothetical protein
MRVAEDRNDYKLERPISSSGVDCSGLMMMMMTHLSPNRFYLTIRFGVVGCIMPYYSRGREFDLNMSVYIRLGSPQRNSREISDNPLRRQMNLKFRISTNG